MKWFTKKNISIIVGLTLIGVLLAVAFNAIWGNSGQHVAEVPSQQAHDEGIESVFRSADKPEVNFESVRDRERKENIDALKVAIDNYFAQHGKYPTIQNMNSKAFRDNSLNSLTRDSFADPLEREQFPKLVSGPQPGSYAYDARGADGFACDRIGETCAHYTLTAVFENNDHYQRTDNE